MHSPFLCGSLQVVAIHLQYLIAWLQPPILEGRGGREGGKYVYIYMYIVHMQFRVSSSLDEYDSLHHIASKLPIVCKNFVTYIHIYQSTCTLYVYSAAYVYCVHVHVY